MLVYLQITITAALGFDSFLVMRHGAGPMSSMKNLLDETPDCSSAMTADMKNLSLTNKNPAGERLGCYFCNDVVAPVDVMTLKLK